MLMVTHHSAVIGMLGDGGEGGSEGGYPEIERYTDVDLFHITRVEQLPLPDRRPG
jgi:hypothetical protein